MRARVIGLICAIPLAGCAVQQAKQDTRAAISLCKATIPEAIGHYADLARCKMEAVEVHLDPVLTGADSARMDALMSLQVELASRVDRGLMTRDEANAEVQATRAQYSEESQQDAIARQAAASQALGALAAYQQAIKPAPVYQIPYPSRPVQTECTQNGQFTNCTSQ